MARPRTRGSGGSFGVGGDDASSSFQVWVHGGPRPPKVIEMRALKQQRTARTSKLLVIGLLAMAFCISGAGYWVLAADVPQQEQRDAATKHMQNGDWKDAADIFQRLATDPKSDAGQVSGDLTNAIQCLRNLGRVDEVDALREKAIEVHKDNWRLLFTAAQTYEQVEQFGFIVAGQFYRGGHRGNDAKPVNTIELDRVRALQLMKQAADTAQAEANKVE